jgi:hypothetical protein
LSTSAFVAPTFGIYLYGWYDPPKWKAHRQLHTPLIGYYDSKDALVINWQVEQIRRTGIDYVVFEMVSVSDVSFAQCMSHAGKFIEAIKDVGIGYTFLIDFAVMKRSHDPVADYAAVIAELQRRGWLRDVMDIPGRGKSIFLFASYPDLVPAIRARTPSHLNLYCAAWSPSWDFIDPTMYDPALVAVFDRDWKLAIEKGIRYADAVEPLGYVQFWQKTDQTLALNGFASVCPGYDDLLLKRDPQLSDVLPRGDGKTFVSQLQAAIASGAPDILIYSWNEYFEASGIEPTIEFGDFYLELVRRLIAQAKAGEDIHFPNDLAPPRPAAPLYLNADLERSGRKHADGLPRWGFNDFVAEITYNSAPMKGESCIILSGVQVKNIGDRSWRIGTETLPIRLGVQIYDSDGRIAREGRAELGTSDLKPGDMIVSDVSIEIARLPRGEYRARLGVVWEGRMWFETTVEIGIFL